MKEKLDHGLTPKPTPPFKGITSAYDRLLQGDERMPIGLYHLHLATAEQLCRLHYSPGCIKAIKARMLTLATHHYVQADAIPAKSSRPPYYYALGREGIRYLAQAGVDISNSVRASKETDKSYLFIRHTLELNDLIISAALLNRMAPTYSLNRFIHERELKQKPYKDVWQGKKLTLIPDAFLDFHTILSDGKRGRRSILCEHDRGTEQQKSFRWKIRKYITFLKDGAYKDLFDTKAITIAFTTFASNQRLAHMRAWTQAELATTNESRAIGLRFRFASLTKPLNPQQVWLEPCWYTPYVDGSQEPVALLVG